jgi:hypothetical protein
MGESEAHTPVALPPRNNLSIDWTEGTRWCIWSRHCSRSLMVVGSIPDGVIDIILPAALWSWGQLSLQQKWIPGIFPGRYRRPVCRADNLTIFMCFLSWNMGFSPSWTLRASSDLYRDCFTFCFTNLFGVWWAPHPVWTFGKGEKSLVSARIRIPDYPVLSVKTTLTELSRLPNNNEIIIITQNLWQMGQI